MNSEEAWYLKLFKNEGFEVRLGLLYMHHLDKSSGDVDKILAWGRSHVSIMSSEIDYNNIITQTHSPAVQ